MKRENEFNGSGQSLINRRGFIGGSIAAFAGFRFIKGPLDFKPGNDPENDLKKIRGYRTLGRTGFKVSDIGLGGVELTTPALVKAALDAGINYIDTAESYLRGQSERNIGKALKEYDRKSIFITTKLGFRPQVTKAEIKERTRKCLERLQTDYIDCLMIHGTPTLEVLKAEGFHAAVKELKAEGKVRFCGLSNHGSQYRHEYQDMGKIMTAAAHDGRFDVALFVYNFLQRKMGENILKVFQEKNIGAILMKVNPVLEHIELAEYVKEREDEGKDIPDRLRLRLDLYKKRMDQAEAFKRKYKLQGYKQMRDAAIKFVLGHPGVHSVTFSIKDFEQLEAYVSLSGSRLDAVDKQALDIYKTNFGPFYCRHACGLCEYRCPEGVPVNTIMRYLHYFRAQGREKAAMRQYAALKGEKAEGCEACAGYCQQACPFGVPIHGLLTAAHQTLTLT